MAMRGTALCVTLFGLTTVAIAQMPGTAERWTPVGSMSQTITGRVTFMPTEITFQNSKSLSLTRGGELLFRPEPKQKKVVADLYRVTAPDDPTLENGNKLCKGKPVTFLIVWKPEKIANATDPRAMAPFSGQKLIAGSPDDCGRYVYDAGSH
jgi:hypothetical protein